MNLIQPEDLIAFPTTPDYSSCQSPSASDECILCEFAKDAKRILELGTYGGYSTINLAKFSPPDATIYTLDSYVYCTKPDLSWLKAYPELLSKITFINADSATYDFIRNGLTDFDLIFIDGNHQTSYVAADSRLAFQLIRPTGTIVWHDWYRYDNGAVSDITVAVEALGYRPKAIGEQLAFLSPLSTRSY